MNLNSGIESCFIHSVLLTFVSPVQINLGGAKLLKLLPEFVQGGLQRLGILRTGLGPGGRCKHCDILATLSTLPPDMLKTCGLVHEDKHN